jgi:CHAD domain-containing protein
VKRELYQRELSGRSLDRMERATLKKLAEVLGELQDLDVLREALRRMEHWGGPVRQLVARTLRELKARALRLGAARYPEAHPRGRPARARSE